MMMKAALERVEMAGKENNETQMAQLLAKAKAVDDTISQAIHQNEDFTACQKRRFGVYLNSINQYIEQQQKDEADRKMKEKAEIEQMIEHIRPALEQVEQAQRERKEKMRAEYTSSYRAIKNALSAAQENQAKKITLEIALRYPRAAAALGFFKMEEYENATQCVSQCASQCASVFFRSTNDAPQAVRFQNQGLIAPQPAMAQELKQEKPVPTPIVLPTKLGPLSDATNQ